MSDFMGGFARRSVGDVLYLGGVLSVRGGGHVPRLSHLRQQSCSV